MIVVAIPNTDRTRDLTPTHVDADPPYYGQRFLQYIGRRFGGLANLSYDDYFIAIKDLACGKMQSNLNKI